MTYAVAGVSEYAPLGSVQSCPAGDNEFVLIDGKTVKRLSNGASLFSDLTSSFACFDPIALTETVNVAGKITGGLRLYRGERGFLG